MVATDESTVATIFRLTPVTSSKASDKIRSLSDLTNESFAPELTIKYAGYVVCFSGSPSFKKLGSRLSFLSPMIMVIAKKKLDFQYPDSAHKVLSPKGEIIFKSESIGH